jgi:Sec-independent protein translocase protein TatA
MSVGFGQILVIILLLVLLFGDVPSLVKNVVNGVKSIKQSFQEDEPKKIEQDGDSSKDIPSKRKDL